MSTGSERMSTEKTKTEHVVPEKRFPVLKNSFGFKNRTEKDGGILAGKWIFRRLSGWIFGEIFCKNRVEHRLSTKEPVLLRSVLKLKDRKTGYSIM